MIHNSTALFVLALCSLYGQHSQVSWHFGPGYPGPTAYFAYAFNNEYGVNWEDSGDFIYLDLSSSRHLVGKVEGTLFVHSGDIRREHGYNYRFLY